ncbi:symmetrical bis(5'-nucleosyl)-tetraphosphatase [Kinneretia asaccharophila]|uniref:bis(5'-nucleosyl)-tetraphosphatase (symmetrical) n=1 Tax=Roseateles asaccharophilus TaxID=582607 RepID=A0A4R6MU52_9BURK|nr:symmetrical bis(5'-nucleosyl)-tetraphosphatase [Roseateles asaccharophilus]MDN3546260.1 symmetrical bis(5'-nucleosyl)-tetraphosphatase [Roseateles asaccharophilus]TDP05638.1 bis(5'nucleosyl)-tetraphosphatase ApaH [Roseateles asaccharophilus]
MHYLIGDLQGCCDAFERLLATLDFSPSRDRLYLLGDLVNRGPASLATLRRLQGLGGAATCLLGNHDLHLLAMAAGVRKPHKGDTAQEILSAPDREALLDWLRQQRMACFAQGWLMVHAGVLPAWSTEQTLDLAAEVEALLRGPELAEFLPQMYGNEPERWDEGLRGVPRLRCIINALTRLRFCDAQGRMDFKTKDGADAAPPGYMPWFDVPGRRSAGTPIAFGHWSTLGQLLRPDLAALDTGCVWGGQLSALRVDGGRRELIQVECAQAQVPGG